MQPIIDANLKIFYDKCWQEKLQVKFAVRGVYDDIRNELTITINEINHSFQDLSVQDKFIQIMTNPIYYRVMSKAICYILNNRRFNVYR